MSTNTLSSRSATARSRTKRSIEDWLAPLTEAAARSESLLCKPCGRFELSNRSYTLPRYLFVGPKGGDDPFRIGLFASLHGDQPESTAALVRFLEILDGAPELARDYFLFVYPICNPTGFEDNTRCSRRGRDLNREFWNNTLEPEVALLQSEICSHAFDGIISLHGDDSSSGLYALTRGYTAAKNLVEPALQAADPILPRDTSPLIDGFPAKDGIVLGAHRGALSGPPGLRPRPFEIALCAPTGAAQYQQEQGLILALQSILASYREMRAYAANL